MEGRSTSYGKAPVEGTTVSPPASPSASSSASETSTEQGEDADEGEDVAAGWDAVMATLKGEFGTERLARFSITHAKSVAVAKLVTSAGQDERMLRAAEATFALVACARARNGRRSEAYMLEKFNAFGVRGGTQAEFDSIKSVMLDDEPPLPTEVEGWLSRFYFVLEVSDAMRELFDAPKARYESAMSLCQMSVVGRRTMGVVLVVANAIINLVKAGEMVGGVDAGNRSRYALDELTRFANADGTEEEYRRVLMVVARMDLPEFDWHLYRRWVDVYATILRKLTSYRAEELEFDVWTTTKLFVALLEGVDKLGLLTHGQSDRLAKKVASMPSGAKKQFYIAGEVAIAIWRNVRQGIAPDSCDADALQIVDEKVAELRAIKGTHKQVFDMANEGFMEGAEESPSVREVELWTRWIDRCDLGDGQTLAFPRELADRARELEGDEYLDGRERRWDVSLVFAYAQEEEEKKKHSGPGKTMAEQWCRCCAASNPPQEAVWNDHGHLVRAARLPFIREMGEDGKVVGKFPSVEMDNVTEKRTMRVQFEIMERCGAYGWLDQQFHPLCSFQGVMRTINVVQARIDFPPGWESDTVRGPNRDAAQYKRKVHRMSECARAIEEDAPERFDCSAFSESLFKGEPESQHKGCMSDSSISGAFYRAVNFSLEKADHFGKGERRVEEWKDKVRQLARMRDVIATMMADAICEQLHKRVGRNVANEVYDAPPFSDEPWVCQFDDRTAPILFTAYWMSVHPGMCTKQLWASARRCWAAYPRKLFANTGVVKEVFRWQRLGFTFMCDTNVMAGKNDFVAMQHPTMLLNDGREVAKPRGHQRQLHAALKSAVNFDHWSDWTMHELIAGASALITYAKRVRRAIGAKASKLPTHLADSRMNTYTQEAKSNLLVAWALLRHAKHWVNEPETDLLQGNPSQRSEGGIRRADMLLAEARDMEKLWATQDAARIKKEAARQRREEKEVAEEERRRTEGEARAVSQFVGGVLATVRRTLQDEWAEEERRRKEEEARRERERRLEALRLAKEAKRKEAERKELLARVIQINRDAATRREAHLAKRAVLEKKAVALEKRQQAEAERAQRKAEEEERAARIRRELEVEERAREQRRVEEEARVAAEARIAEAAAAAERVRATEAARRAREREAARVLEEQRLREEERRLEAERVIEEQRRREADVARVAAIAVASRAGRAGKAVELALVDPLLLRNAFAKWAKAAASRKAQQLAEARRATQARCQEIMDKQHRKSAESSSPPSPPSPSTLPDANADAEAEAERATREHFSTSQQWQKDYRNELQRLKRATQIEWSTGTGWAEGASMMVHMYGPEYVNARARAREQWDVSRATFSANLKHMDRVRTAQYNQVKSAQVSECKDMDERFRADMATLKEERREIARRRRKMVTNVSNYNNQTATERRAHSVDVCAMLRGRPQGGDATAASSSMAAASVHECIVCFDAPCTHIATSCGHVIGCGACCALQTACPICRVPTAFVKMRFPH